MTADKKPRSELESIVEQAARELEEEQRRAAVDVAKQKIRAARWWHKLFPWRITITKRTP